MSQPAAYDIIPYSFEKFKEILLKSSSGSTMNIVDQKTNSNYFKDYFNALDAKTIIIEEQYIDHDYLDDYTGYYVRCFARYKRKCKRLHFFSIDVEKTDFESLLGKDNTTLSEDQLDNAYLGFIVIKPLPKTIIGRTCLKTYDSDNKRRFFPITCDCSANLFGIKLTVESLPFQEQDTVVSACATSALWSVFQYTAKKYQHEIPSPLRITQIACDSVPGETRYLLNKGLTAIQMAYAIRSVGLEPYYVRASDDHVLKSTSYAYLTGKTPGILLVTLVDTSEGAPAEVVGLHAIAITGYSLGNTTTIQNGNGVCLKASRIDKLYGHDDQIGPFSRLVLDGTVITYVVNGQTKSSKSILTSWAGKNKIPGSIRAIPDILLFPVYNKIRISFDIISDFVIYFNGIIEFLRETKIVPLNKPVEWDIRLTTVNEFKCEFLNSSLLPPNKTREILLSEYPRFLWRATAYQSDNRLLDLLYDATEIEQGLTLYKAIGYDNDLYNSLVVLSKIKGIGENHPSWKTLGWFEKQFI
jgi:hypothetical protein